MSKNLNLWIIVITIFTLSLITDVYAYVRYSNRQRSALRRQLPARTYDYDSVY